MNQIKYLASSLELPLQGEETLDSVQPGLLATRTYKQMLAAQADGTWSYSVKIAEVLLCMAQKNYQQELSQDSQLFGQNSSTWRTAYQIYQTQFLRVMNAVVQDEIVQTTLYSPEELKTWKLLMVKLKATVLHRSLTGPGWVPALDGMVPLLCPDFMDHLLEMVMEIEAPLSIASLAFLLAAYSAKPIFRSALGLCLVCWIIASTDREKRLQMIPCNSTLKLKAFSIIWGIFNTSILLE
jgi:hypothetical protein